MRQEVYYQRGADDPIHSEEVVLDIVRQYLPGARALNYIDETGGEARMYAVDEDIILKVQRPHQLRMSTSLEKEAFFLMELEKQCNINVPRVHGYGRAGDIEYTCMSRIPGAAFKNVELTPDERQVILYELAKVLRKIHGIDQSAIAECGLFPKDDPPDLVERLRLRAHSAIKSKAHISAEQGEVLFTKIEAELQKIKKAGPFVALHVNPAITHTFVDPLTRKYSGLIDFGDAYIGHPIFDFWRWPVLDREMLLKGYIAAEPVSEDFMLVYEAANNIDRITESL